MNETLLPDRLARVEASLAHAERQIDELNAVLVEQGRELTRLRKRLEQVGETIAAQELERVQGLQQKPPHWTV